MTSIADCCADLSKEFWRGFACSVPKSLEYAK